MAGKVLLFDNPSRFGSGTCWSPNVWKTRLLLNFKGFDYGTEWIDLEEIKPLFSSFGIKPHTPMTELADYTIPTVQMPDGTYIMESKQIAEAIEKAYPNPCVHLDNKTLPRVEKLRKEFGGHLQAYLVPRMPSECLSGANGDWHRAHRRETYHMSLEEYEAKYGGDLAWERAMPALKEMAALLNENSDGPFALGQTPSYADFVIVSFLEWCRVLGGDCLGRMYSVDPAFEKVYDACKPWLMRFDH